jgi:hypothetical protein
VKTLRKAVSFHEKRVMNILTWWGGVGGRGGSRTHRRRAAPSTGFEVRAFHRERFSSNQQDYHFRKHLVK